MRSYSLQEGLDGEGNIKKCHLHTTVAETFMCKASGTFWYLAGPCSAPHPFLSGPLQACAAFFRSPTKTPQPRHSKDAGVPTNWENKPSSMPLQPSPSTDLAPWLPLLLNPTPNLRGWDQPSCKRSASPLQLHKPSLFFSLSVIVSFQFTFFSVYRHNKYASNPKKRNNPNLTKTQHTHTYLPLTSCNHCPLLSFPSQLQYFSCHPPSTCAPLKHTTFKITNDLLVSKSSENFFILICYIWHGCLLLLLESLHSLGFYVPWFSCSLDYTITDPTGEIHVLPFQKLP